MKEKRTTILFLLILLIVATYYNYHEIAFKRPQSIHKWRQSDCASIALNYYQGGMKFFVPETHNLTSDGGTTGMNCTSEIPFFYYGIAILYKIFGYHEFIYRIINTLLFFLGLFYLFKLLQLIVHDNYWSITLPLLLFTSPVLVYYGNNFLTNSSALSFSFIGWYYFIRYVKENHYKWFVIAMLFFLIGGAFKVTAFFSVFSLLGILLTEWIGITKFNNEKKLFRKPTTFFVIISSILLIVIAWIFYANNFNIKHDSTYFSTTIFPIWDLDTEGRRAVVENVKNVWLRQYFHTSVLIGIALCAIYIIVLIKKGNKLLNLVLLFILVEVVFYVLLQFFTFRDHDYYMIDVFILPVLIIVTAFESLSRNYPNVLKSLIGKIIFALVLLFNIYYAGQQIRERYKPPKNNYECIKDFYSVTPYLHQLGITENDTVISIPDGSHVSLYLMNVKGWTEYNDSKFNRGEKIYYNQSEQGIQQSINKGASYLIVNGKKELYLKPYLQPFCKHLLGKYNQILVFDLKDSTCNFILDELVIDKQYKCDAEIVSTNGELFHSKADSLWFRNGKTRSDELALNGKYSVKLFEQQRYGMTSVLNNMKIGECVSIRVWRKQSGDAQGTIIASSDGISKFYQSKTKVVETNIQGWERIEMKFFITPELANVDLITYLYNPAQSPCYFDDFELVRYRSVFD